MFSPVTSSECKVTHYQQTDAMGNIPPRFINSAMAQTIDAVDECRVLFQRDHEVDEQMLSEYAAVFAVPQVYTAQEDLSFTHLHASLSSLDQKDFKDLESPDPLTKMSISYVRVDSGLSSASLRATTVIDASVEECAAYEMCKTTREQSNGQIEEGYFDLNEKQSDHCTIMRMVLDLDVPGLSVREFLTAQTWRWQGDNIAVTYASMKHKDYPPRKGYVRGAGQEISIYEKLEPVLNIPQTRRTMTMTANLKGVIPEFLVASSATDFLAALTTNRKYFDKSLEIDEARRARNVEMITEHGGRANYSDEEKRIAKDGVLRFMNFYSLKSRTLKMTSPLTNAKIASRKGDRCSWGWASTTVRASAKEVLALLWDTERRAGQRDDDLEKAVDERVNEHNMLVYHKKKSPHDFIDDRDFQHRIVWKQENEGIYLYMTAPEVNPNRVQGKDVARARLESSMRIKSIGEKLSSVEYVAYMDAGGRVPSFVVNAQVGSNLRRITVIQEYFQALRGLEEWDAEDGRSVGEVMCVKTKAERSGRIKGETKVGARVRGMFERYVGLKEAGERWEFLEPLLVRVMQNKLRMGGEVKTKLCSVSAKEGPVVGRGLAMAMATNLTAEAGVDEWILKYRSLKELDREEVWFRPMMNVVAKRLLGEVSWGLKMRVIMGAGLSILDMATDIFVIVGYMRKPETKGYGMLLLWMVVGSMVLQLAVVFVQVRRVPSRAEERRRAACVARAGLSAQRTKSASFARSAFGVSSHSLASLACTAEPKEAVDNGEGDHHRINGAQARLRRDARRVRQEDGGAPSVGR